jgi:hypothetical protein
VALADKVHNARSIVRDHRDEGPALWERFKEKNAREQLWYYSGLLEFFDRRRPGPLTEDLRRSRGWSRATRAQQSEHLRLWLDADLHDGQAPEGWVQVRTLDEELLEAFPALALSLDDAPEAHKLIDWLVEQTESGGPDRWPSEEVSFHGSPAPGADCQLAAAIERHAQFRGGT